MKTLLTALIVLSLAACATNPDKIAAQHVSANDFDNLTCDQIQAEYARATSDLATLNKSMKSMHRTNVAAVTVGMILFWPALFFVKSKNQTNDQALAELKGRHAALELAGDNCAATTQVSN